MSALEKAVDVAACFRLTKLVIDDKITEDLRNPIFDRFPPESTKIGYLITCPWCVSFWAGLAVTIARRRWKHWPILADALAMSAATGWAAEHE